MTGQILSFDGEIFRVETEFGTLSLDQSDVICRGPGCPELTAYIAEIDVYADNDLMRNTIAALLAGFATEQGYRVVQRIELGFGRRFEVFEPDTNQQVGVFRLLRDPPPENATSAVHISRERNPWADGQSRVIALDAIVAVSGDETSDDRVPIEDLKALTKADELNWAALGNGDLPLDLVLPSSPSAASDVLADWMRRDLGLTDPDDLWSRSWSDAPDTNPLAFGFTTLSAMQAGNGLGLEGACGATSFPTPSAIRTGEYPLGLPVSLHRPPGRLPRLGREFVRYASSDFASKDLAASGLVPLALFEVPFHVQGHRLGNAILLGLPEAGRDDVTRYVQVLRERSRLSLGFRFLDGSTTLDATSSTNVERIAEAVAAGRFDGKTLTFAGFSDSVGEGAANLRLSVRRAEAVLAAVASQLTEAERALVAFEAVGFGEAVPVVCNDTSENRRINRRVEVWVGQR